ncbi:MAG: helix-turn-helix transcriptional regulator [Candidatus Lambdaproteobacteria bacterium]|nr:helix-turn-helix transcriptional regulator [Candidatus Lambdaproteobacteria bacterium]
MSNIAIHTQAAGQTLEEYAAAFKALSNPHRVRIFRRLMTCCAPGTPWRMDEAMRPCVSVLGKDLGIVPSTVSHHIKELQRAGLIRTQREGQSVKCWIDPAIVEAMRAFFALTPG